MLSSVFTFLSITSLWVFKDAKVLSESKKPIPNSIGARYFIYSTIWFLKISGLFKALSSTGFTVTLVISIFKKLLTSSVFSPNKLFLKSPNNVSTYEPASSSETTPYETSVSSKYRVTSCVICSSVFNCEDANNPYTSFKTVS